MRYGSTRSAIRRLAVEEGVRLAYDMEQLVAESAAYVRDRSRDRDKRVRLVAEECGQVDGRAAERIAQLITNIISTSE